LFAPTCRREALAYRNRHEAASAKTLEAWWHAVLDTYDGLDPVSSLLTLVGWQDPYVEAELMRDLVNAVAALPRRA
jgi:hypothetical protein